MKKLFFTLLLSSLIGGKGVSAVGSNCPDTVVINKSLTWTEADDTVLNVAKDGCKRYYGVDSCLKTFIKKEELNYHAICKTYK